MITLRDFIPSDTTRLVEVLNDELVTQYLTSRIPSPYTIKDAQWWVEEGSAGELVKAIIFNNTLVGCIGVDRGKFEYQKSAEIGYWLAPEYWRKGITLSALNQMVDYVFTHTDIVRLTASVFTGNHASMQLLLKAGFENEAVLNKAIFKNGQYFDNHVFVKFKPL